MLIVCVETFMKIRCISHAKYNRGCYINGRFTLVLYLISYDYSCLCRGAKDCFQRRVFFWLKTLGLGSVWVVCIQHTLKIIQLFQGQFWGQCLIILAILLIAMGIALYSLRNKCNKEALTSKWLPWEWGEKTSKQLSITTVIDFCNKWHSEYYFPRYIILALWKDVTWYLHLISSGRILSSY